MKEVSKEAFYEALNDLDVCVSVESVYVKHYTSLFKFRNDVLFGKVTPVLTEYGGRKYPVEYNYFLSE